MVIEVNKKSLLSLYMSIQQLFPVKDFPTTSNRTEKLVWLMAQLMSSKKSYCKQNIQQSEKERGKVIRNNIP